MGKKVDNKKILFVTGEGVGNVCQTIPSIRTLDLAGYKIDFLHAFGAFHLPKFIPYIDNWFTKDDINKIKPKDYCGIISTKWTTSKLGNYGLSNVKLLASSSKAGRGRSEVEAYMDIPRSLGITENKIKWHGDCKYKKIKSVYDIVVHNGYKFRAQGKVDWSVKRYESYEKVVNSLKDEFKICSVGDPTEYIKGTHNETGHNLLTTLGIIKNSKVFVGNDSGLYHCANALSVPNIVIFTATSVKKNYDKRFHRYSTIISRDDLKCRKTCQYNHYRWMRCNKWRCKKIRPKVVVNKIRELII